MSAEDSDDDVKAAELRDEILFRQPESSHLGDCPICYLPLPIGLNKTFAMSCCSKFICKGCYYANLMREAKGRLGHKCLFCRMPEPTSEEMKMNCMKRVEANDPLAMTQMGGSCMNEGDYIKAFDYYTKAAELGHVAAHYNLSILYHDGKGVEKDEEMALYHLEEAGIGGHVDARYDLGIFEGKNGRFDRTNKHLIIATNLGHDKSLELLKENYADGYVAKKDFALTLRTHHAAVKATKSPQREWEEVVRQKAEAARAAQSRSRLDR